LNAYFIPIAGAEGAAAATSISMLLYFLLFSRKLESSYKIPKGKYIAAGLGVYLILAVFAEFLHSAWQATLFTPVAVIGLFFGMGFYDIRMREDSEEAKTPQLTKGASTHDV
jgi:O-antigen/teichoic acid export membrane protein